MNDDSKSKTFQPSELQLKLLKLREDWLRNRGTKVRPVQGLFDRWIIVRADDPGLAWSGSQFVPHDRGIPTGGIHVSNFTDRERAVTYAKAAGLEVEE